LGIYKIGSHAGFESASELRRFGTRMQVDPTKAGQLAGLVGFSYVYVNQSIILTVLDESYSGALQISR